MSGKQLVLYAGDEKKKNEKKILVDEYWLFKQNKEYVRKIRQCIIEITASIK